MVSPGQLEVTTHDAPIRPLRIHSLSIHTNTMSSHYCDGCGAVFTSNSGWSNHLRQTTQSQCIAVREQEFAREQALFSAPSNSFATAATLTDTSTDIQLDAPGLYPDVTVAMDVDMDAAPAAFEGDFFSSAYNDADFGQLSDDPPSSSHSFAPSPDTSESDVSDDEAHPSEPHWEPPPPLTSFNPPQDAPSSDSITLDTNEAVPDSRRAEVDVRPPKTYVVHFPSDRAGTPLPVVDVKYTYGHYRVGLEHGNTSSLYSPFISKMDWDVARWAKERGPGSTALTELLQIEEVR